MTKPHNEQLTLARRWDKCVDFGSPMSAWTPEMLEVHRRRTAAKAAGATHMLQHPEGIFEYYLDGLTEIAIGPDGTAVRGRRWSQEIANQYERREL